MLFVWLFAVFASWANACLVQPAGQSATVRGHHKLADAGAAQGDAHIVAAGGTTHDSDPAKELCADICDTGQSIVAKPQPSKGEGPADPSLFLAIAPAAWSAFVPGQLDPHWRPLAAPPPPRLRLAIAFLRLTL